MNQSLYDSNYVYKEGLEELSLTDVANEFCRESETRLNTFGKLSDKDIPQQFSKKVSVATIF